MRLRRTILLKMINFVCLAIAMLQMGNPMNCFAATREVFAAESSAAATDIVSQNLVSVVEPAVEHNYAIYVNRAWNCITIMDTDAAGNQFPVRAFACSCGRQVNATPTGNFQTSNYYVWRDMFGNCYARYAVRYGRNLLFHSVPYNTRNSANLNYNQYNKLGSPASSGCIRLAVADAKWIYENTTPGTPVVIYSDPDNPGPLGKPQPIRVDTSSPYRGWDPTDPDPNNPWIQETLASPEYQAFDEIAYTVLYPELGSIYGTDKLQLWFHYRSVGVYEVAGMPLRPTLEEQIAYRYQAFDEIAYADEYPDLKEVYGINKLLLWRHYISIGANEGRTAVFR